MWNVQERDTIYAQQPAYLTLAHVQGMTVDGLRVIRSPEACHAHPRSALSGHALEDGVLRDIRRQPKGAEGQPPAIVLHNCRRILQAHERMTV